LLLLGQTEQERKLREIQRVLRALRLPITISGRLKSFAAAIYLQESDMSAPSRRPEIRRRRTRKEKVLKLRKRLGAASAETDRKNIEQKLHKLGLVSPGIPLLKKA